MREMIFALMAITWLIIAFAVEWMNQSSIRISWGIPKVLFLLISTYGSFYGGWLLGNNWVEGLSLGFFCLVVITCIIISVEVITEKRIIYSIQG